jgi:nitrogen fixation protein FixH
MVLLCLISFFAVVTVVNVIMMTAAVKTFGGLETASSYKAGLDYSRDAAASQEQGARHWTVTSRFDHNSDGRLHVELSVLDGAKQPLSGYQAHVLLAHPANRRLDHEVEVWDLGNGRYGGDTVVPAGQWDLEIDITRDGKRYFRSRERIFLKDR